MQTLGAYLRQAREARGETLEQAEEATHIRSRFLEALEVWDLAAFPGGDVQIRGFLRIYARYLGLPADEVLARYKSGGQPAGAATSGKPVPPPRQPPVVTSRPRWMSVEKLIIASVLLILLLTIGVGGWYLVSQKFGGGKISPPATTALASEADLYPTLTPSTAQSSPLAVPTILPNPGGGVTVTLEATEHVWARVAVDGNLVFEGMLAPDQVETWSGQELVIVDAGNGAGVQVTVNEQPQGALCGRGELCSRGWGPGGEVVVPKLTPTAVP